MANKANNYFFIRSDFHCNICNSPEKEKNVQA